MDKLYIVIRSDISSGLQISQSCHALSQFAFEHKEIYDSWFTTSNYIIILSVNNEKELLDLLGKADYYNIRYSLFREPDLDDTITAIALEPGNKTKKICQNLPLALSTNH